MKRIIYLLLAVTIVFASCSKKDNLPATKEKKLVKLTQDIGNNTVFTYDESGRVVKMTTGDVAYLYEYSGNTIREKIHQLSIDETISNILWTLNAKGQAISGAGVYWVQSPQPVNMNITNTFDDSGRLLAMTVVGNNNTSSSFEYYYSGDDIIEAKRFINNTFDGKTKFYYPGKISDKIKLGVAEQQLVPGLIAFGKTNEHLVEKIEHINKNGVLTGTFNYQYIIDADGYPAQKNVSGSSTNIEFYHYN